MLTLSLYDEDEHCREGALSHLDPSSTTNQAELIEALIHFILLEPNRRLKGVALEKLTSSSCASCLMAENGVRGVPESKLAELLEHLLELNEQLEQMDSFLLRLIGVEDRVGDADVDEMQDMENRCTQMMAGTHRLAGYLDHIKKEKVSGRDWNDGIQYSYSFSCA